MVDSVSPSTLLSFLPPETVEMLKEYGDDFPKDLAFEEQMTILFSDMRGFTELAETNDPKCVYNTINASLDIQTQIVTKHGGSINKFLGDGLLACFSGPERGEHALNCLLELLKELPLREKKNGLLPCRVGFGMHDGKVLYGLVGSKERKEFAVIGDVVNTAARLCGLAQPFQGLLTEASMQTLSEDASRDHCRFLNSVYLKGKRESMNVFYVEQES